MPLPTVPLPRFLPDRLPRCDEKRRRKAGGVTTVWHGKISSPARASPARRPAPEVGRGKKKVDRGPKGPICFPVRFRKELQRMEPSTTRKWELGTRNERRAPGTSPDAWPTVPHSGFRVPSWIRFLRGGIGATDPKGA